MSVVWVKSLSETRAKLYMLLSAGLRSPERGLVEILSQLVSDAERRVLWSTHPLTSKSLGELLTLLGQHVSIRELEEEYRTLFGHFSPCRDVEEPLSKELEQSPNELGIELVKAYTSIVEQLSEDLPKDVPTGLEYMEALTEEEDDHNYRDIAELEYYLLNYLYDWGIRLAECVEKRSRTGFYRVMARLLRSYLEEELRYLSRLIGIE